MKKRLFYLYFIVMTFSLNAEVILSGKAGAQAGFFMDLSAFLDSPQKAEFYLYPALQAYGDRYEFYSQAAIQMNDLKNIPGIFIGEFNFSLFLGDYLKFNLGKFQYQPGMANLNGPLSFFQTVEYDRLLEGRTNSANFPTGLLQGTLFLGDFFIKATGQFIRNPFSFVKPKSVWFPRNQFPDSIQVSFPSPRILPLKEIIIEETNIGFNIFDFSASLELGGTFSSMDVSLLYYYGYNNSPMFLVTPQFPNGLVDFNLDLKPVFPKNHALGVSLSYSADPLLFYSDMAIILDKAYKVTNNLEDELEYSRSAYFQIAAGMSFFWEKLNLLTIIEYNSADFFNAAPAQPLFLNQLAFLSLSWLDPNDKIKISLNNIVELNNFSFVNALQFVWNLDFDIELKLYVPFFWGEPQDDLGQFNDNHYLAISAEWIF